MQYHGTDGFGDVYTDNPDISNLQDLNAMFALNNIVAHNPGTSIITQCIIIPCSYIRNTYDINVCY